MKPPNEKHEWKDNWPPQPVWRNVEDDDPSWGLAKLCIVLAVIYAIAAIICVALWSYFF